MGGLSLAADRMPAARAPSGKGIVRPGEVVTLDADFDGPVIECARLVVEPGVVVRATVKAVYASISGRVEGVVRLSGKGSYAVVEEGGSVAGEIHAASIEIRGDVDGICHASSVVLLASSRIDGGILTDSLINHPTARIRGATFVGPGLVSNKSMLDGLRNMASLAATAGRQAETRQEPVLSATRSEQVLIEAPRADEEPMELELDDDLFESQLLAAAEERRAAQTQATAKTPAREEPAPRAAAPEPAPAPRAPPAAAEPEAAAAKDAPRQSTAFPFLVARRG